MSAGVVIVNYNCAPLALDAALSALGDDATSTVIIVDNCSTDTSLEYFKRIFSDRRAHLPAPPSGGPVSCQFADIGTINCAVRPENSCESLEHQLTVVAARRNRGFAAGCNLGMSVAARRKDVDWFLLLNPDALIGKGAMDAFRKRLEDKNAGLCGASVLRFEAPHHIQALGGASLDSITLLGKNVGWDQAFGALPPRSQVEAQLDYPLGAAMALKAEYRTHYGDLDERYFLYYEEVDWALRGGNVARTVWADDAIIYHRHGAAAGSQIREGARGTLSEYHMARSRMLFALKWRPWLMPLILVLSAVQAARRVLRGRSSQARALLLGAFGRPWSKVTN